MLEIIVFIYSMVSGLTFNKLRHRRVSRAHSSVIRWGVNFCACQSSR